MLPAMALDESSEIVLATVEEALAATIEWDLATAGS